MANRKAKERTPASELLLKFLKDNGIVLLADIYDVTETAVPDAVYTLAQKSRVRALYLDEIQKKDESHRVVN